MNDNEAYDTVEGKKLVTIEQKLNILYEAIFVTEYDYRYYHTKLGDYEFDSNSRKFAMEVASMLSSYADFQI